MSTRLLWAASGRVYGPCPVTVRPCARRCLDAYVTTSLGRSRWTPYLDTAGRWRNATTCGCGDACGCGELSEVALDGPVVEVTSVTIDGATVAGWRVDRVGDRAYLVRTDGGAWPACQDLTADCDEDGAFCVTYERGLALDAAAIAAHTELTCELVRACTPNCDCRLPRNVQTKTRQGVTIAFDTSQTWIRALPTVASWLDAVNPGGLPRPVRVASPDARGARRV